MCLVCLLFVISYLLRFNFYVLIVCFFTAYGFCLFFFGRSELIMNAFGFENSVLIKYWCLKPYFYSLKFYNYSEIHKGVGVIFDFLMPYISRVLNAQGFEF